MQQPGTYCKWHHLLLTWQFLCGPGPRGRLGTGTETSAHQRAAGKGDPSSATQPVAVTAGCLSYGLGQSGRSLRWRRNGAAQPCSPRDPCSHDIPRWCPSAPGRHTELGPVVRYTIPSGIPSERGSAGSAPSHGWHRGGRAKGLPRAPSPRAWLAPGSARLCRAASRRAARVGSWTTVPGPGCILGCRGARSPVYVPMETPLCCCFSSQTRQLRGASSCRFLTPSVSSSTGCAAPAPPPRSRLLQPARARGPAALPAPPRALGAGRHKPCCPWDPAREQRLPPPPASACPAPAPARGSILHPTTTSHGAGQNLAARAEGSGWKPPPQHVSTAWEEVFIPAAAAGAPRKS